jgi:hypothetical protein
MVPPISPNAAASNPHKRAKHDSLELCDESLNAKLLYDLTDFVTRAMRVYQNNNLSSLASDANINECNYGKVARVLSMQKFVSQQKRFVDDAVSIYMEQVVPFFTSPAMVIEAARVASAAYENNLEIMLKEVLLNKAVAPLETLSFSHGTFGEVSSPLTPPQRTRRPQMFASPTVDICRSRIMIDTTFIEIIKSETSREQAHSYGPISSITHPIYMFRKTASGEENARPYPHGSFDDHERELEKSVMDVEGFTNGSSTFSGTRYSPLTNPSPFSILAGSVDCSIEHCPVLSP